MFQQITREQNFSWEKKQNNWLKHCWGQVRLVKSEDQQAGHPLPPAYFLIQGGLLYYHVECRGNPVTCWFSLIQKST